MIVQDEKWFMAYIYLSVSVYALFAYFSRLEVLLLSSLVFVMVRTVHRKCVRLFDPESRSQSIEYPPLCGDVGDAVFQDRVGLSCGDT